MADIKFVDGLIIKAPNERTPDFIKMQISINRKSLGNWLRAETDEWINIDIKESKAGKLYASVDTWVPNKQKVADNGAQEATQPVEGLDMDVPFADPYKNIWRCV